MVCKGLMNQSRGGSIMDTDKKPEGAGKPAREPDRTVEEMRELGKQLDNPESQRVQRREEGVVSDPDVPR